MSNNNNELINTAIHFHHKGDLLQAKKIYQHIISIEEENSDANHLLGVIEKQQGDHRKALIFILKAIDLGSSNPNLPDYLNNCGEVYRSLYQPLQSIAYYQRALELRPNFVSSILNMGNAYQQIGDHDEALNCFKKALSIAPTHHSTRFSIALSHLIEEDFQSGWAYYESRFQRFSRRDYQSHPIKKDSILTKPSKCLPVDWSGKQVLILPEQGIGDEIFFLRYFSELTEMGAHVEYLPTIKIAPLLQRDSQIRIKTDKDFTRYDYIFPVGELPLVTNMRSKADIKAPLPLCTDRHLVNQLKVKFKDFPHPWIGITWRGGTAQGLQKEIPCEKLHQLLSNFKGTLFVVQREPRLEELELFKTQGDLQIVDASNLNQNIDEIFALMELLDDYITVSNTNLHLRASLGKSSNVLLPLKVDFKWPNRYQHQRSPWFPGHHTYHQSPNGEWDQALLKLGERLYAAGYQT